MIYDNKFDPLQEISDSLTPNDKYENFVNGRGSRINTNQTKNKIQGGTIKADIYSK